MAHGFSAVKGDVPRQLRRALRRRRTQCAGIRQRNFGASDGEPRQEIDLWAQVDAGRIGIWGSSHSGGHVLVAAIERRVKAVLSQVPLVSGHANLCLLYTSD